LDGFCEAKRWGEVLTGPAAIKMLPDVVREPDLFVLPPEEISKAKGVPLEVRPALVVEIMSPTTRTIDLREKVEDYALARIPEYWAVDPERKEIIIHWLEEEKYRLEHVTAGKIRSRAVPGFWLEAEWPFQEPLPLVAECLQQILKGEEMKHGEDESTS
jgi:Uma2 family endonuclease